MKHPLLAGLGVALLTLFGTSAVVAETLRIGTCGTGGYWYQSGTALANTIDEHAEGLSGRAVPTACTIYNINALARGQQEIGMAVDSRNVLAYLGKGEFEGRGTEGKIRSLTTWYTNYLHIYTLDSDINSVQDLRGKRVAIGVPDGGTNAQAIAVLKAAGLEPGEDVSLTEVNLETGVSQLAAGQIDAQFWLMPVNNPTMTQLTSTRSVNLIPVTHEIADAVPADIGVNLARIDAGTYNNQDEDVAILASSVNLITRADLDDAVVQQVLEVLYDNLDQLHGSLPVTAKEIAEDNALTGLAIPLHPGARKFYESRGFPGLDELDARLESNGMSD